MDWHTLDWDALHRLRQGFLDGTAGAQDYWRKDEDLASYDATFAQRIGWKWDHVLGELAAWGWRPPRTTLVDWGCGSGIAARALLDRFGPESVTGVYCWDRSVRAAQYAATRARTKYPGLEVRLGLPAEPGIVVLSHVLGELTAEQNEALARWLAQAACVLWVEPGTYEISLTLIALRERLRSHLAVLAPCPHQAPCGLLAAGHEADWCHHFAPPPAAVFTDSDWGKFAHVAGIDLRSLVLSYLVLERRPAPVWPEGTVRLLGRPRVFKPYAELCACDADGVRTCALHKRELPTEYRALRKRLPASLQVWTRDGRRVTATKVGVKPEARS